MATPRKIPAFMGTNYASTPKGAKAAFFGAPHGTPYKGIDNRPHAKAADSFRLALKDDIPWLEHWDFDFGGPLLPDTKFKAVDLGNLPTKPLDGRGNRKKIETQTANILSEGAVPIMFGGDDSTPIPFINAFSGGAPLTILQIDAHIDWREERYGERFGYSSTMRRASEMPHVWRIVQAGAHGMGSARQTEVETAAEWGAHIIPSHTIHHRGIDQVIAHIEPESACLISLDLDVLDCTVMPAVAHPSPGGLSFLQVTDIIAAVAAKARIAGFTMVEFVPGRDPLGIAAHVAARIAAHVLNHVTRQGIK
ncbi:MAG: arginase family protein [Alphaproteobacteria bacterium]|nr:arginase family protein [Alphaproteobacteria bacterium]